MKAAPDDFTYGSVGAGASTRLAWEWFMNETDLKMTHLPYPGPSALIPERLNLSLIPISQPTAPY